MSSWEKAALVCALVFAGSFVCLWIASRFGFAASILGQDVDVDRGPWQFVCDDDRGDALIPPPFKGSLRDACDWLEAQKGIFKITGWDSATHVIRYAFVWTEYRQLVPCRWKVIRLDPQDAGDWDLSTMLRSEAIAAALQSGSHVLIGVRDEDRVITVRKNAGKPA